MAAAKARMAQSLLAEAESDEEDTPAPQRPSTPPPGAESDPAAAAAAAGAAAVAASGETRGEVKKRHKKEKLEVEGQARSLVQAAKKKNSVARTLADAQAEQLREALQARHEAELAAAPPGSDDDEGGGGVEAEGAGGAGEEGGGEEYVDPMSAKLAEMGMGGMVPGGGGKKGKSKQQKKREAKAAEEERRYREAKESMKGWEDPKVMEDAQLKERLAPLGLRVAPIQADGHCLYRAVADQCERCVDDGGAMGAAWGGEGGYLKLRRAAGGWMRSHPDDFAPFVVAEDESGAEDPFEAYIQKVEGTAEWGGHLEITALSRCLPAHIHVHSATQAEQVFSPDGDCGTHIQVSYHKHAFGLGEHYNSLHKA